MYHALIPGRFLLTFQAWNSVTFTGMIHANTRLFFSTFIFSLPSLGIVVNYEETSFLQPGVQYYADNILLMACQYTIMYSVHER